MKKKILLKILILIAVLGLSDTLHAQQNQRLAGAELSIRSVDQKFNNQDSSKSLVEVKITYFRDCASTPGRGSTRFPPQDTLLVIFCSKKCCEIVIDTLIRDAAAGEGDATPICPFNNPMTRCDTNLIDIKIDGYKTEIYIDTVFTLPCRADDWRVGHLYSGTLALQNFLTVLQHPQGQGNIDSKPIRPCAAHGIRQQAANMVNLQNDRCEGALYLEAWYDNNVEVIVGGEKKYIANTTPFSAANPFIYQCKDAYRDYNLGYYDLDNHTLSFGISNLYRDAPANFCDPGVAPTPLGIFMPNAPFGFSAAGNPPNTWSVNSTLGSVQFECYNPVGKYKAGFEIQEFDASGKRVGVNMRDIMVTIFKSPNCDNTNSLSNTTYFYPDNDVIYNFTNCAKVPGTLVNTVEVCRGTNVSFLCKAFSTSTTPGASITIDAELPAVMRTSIPAASVVPLFTPPAGGRLEGRSQFSWTVPNNVAPGIYPILFRIKDCVDGLIISRTTVVNIRVNEKTKIQYTTNYKSKLPAAVYSPNREGPVVHCGTGISYTLVATSSSNINTYTWGSTNINNLYVDAGNNLDFETPVILNPNSSDSVIVISSQYCDNRDAIAYQPAPAFSPYISANIIDSCFGSTVPLKVENIPGTGYLFDWQTVNSQFTSTPSYLSNTANALLVTNTNRYNVYVHSPQGCIISLTKTIGVAGIKPRAKYEFTQRFVCPFDTIQLSRIMLTNAICGVSQFSVGKGADRTIEYPGNESYTGTTPKVFTADTGIDRTQTQILYKAKELRRIGMQAGLIKELGFFIDGIDQPNTYNQLQIRVKCTDREDLDNLILEPDEGLTLIFDTAFRVLTSGWNNFVLGKQFTYDDSTNLLFDIRTKCNIAGNNRPPTPPSYFDHLNTYTSMIGKYGKGELRFSNARIVGTPFRHNIRFRYQDLEDSTIRFRWTDVTTSSSITANSVIDSTKDLTKIVGGEPIRYRLKVIGDVIDPPGTQVVLRQKCSTEVYLTAPYDTNMKIDISRDKKGLRSITKCPSDTVQINATINKPVPDSIVMVCGSRVPEEENPVRDSCRIYDSLFFPRIGGVTANVGTPVQSPFGGMANIALSPATDKRIQLLYTLAELRADTMMRRGIIQQIGFQVTNLAPNLNASLANFTVKMRCVPATMDTLPSNEFISSASFKEVYFNPALRTILGMNWLSLTDSFGWDGNSGILVDICYDNRGLPYNGDIVYSTNLVNRRRTLYRSANLADSLGCSFRTGTKDVIRPRISFQICKPTPVWPPIPATTRWAPNTLISNTLIPNPIIYNNATAAYYVIQEYVDTNYGKNIVTCKVSDTFKIIVNRPTIEFTPPKPVACQGSATNVSAGVQGMNQNLYSYQWTTTAGNGISAANASNPNQNFIPPNPGWYYVKVSSLADPDCWSFDSVYVDVQAPTTMPDLGANALICPGDSTTISISTETGYKKPFWFYNSNPLDSGYSIKVGLPGTYFVEVDSGACRNRSNIKFVQMRPKDTATLPETRFTVCEGDTVTIYYSLSNFIANPLWNIGKPGDKIKVTQGGQYYLVNPRDQYGCIMHMKDTAVVTLIQNPEFSLQGDTICVSANEKTTLRPTPFDPYATYTWEPSGTSSPSLDVIRPGVYTVTRTKAGCSKTAQARLVHDTSGLLSLGPDQAICCDEVITLDANVNRKLYSSFYWSTGDRSQFLYTKPNTSGRYYVEAIKHNGCKDTGSIYIESKCAKVEAKPDRESISLGQTNAIKGLHNTVAGNISYKWIPQDSEEKIPNPNILNPTVKPIDTGDVEYVLVMTVSDPKFMPPKPVCTENTVVRFKVTPNKLELNFAFTPNGDGINDYFYPNIKGIVQVKEFKVYNRYGQLLHNDAINPWDGKYNGQLQPHGVYVGLVSYDAEQPRKAVERRYKQFTITIVR